MADRCVTGFLMPRESVEDNREIFHEMTWMDLEAKYGSTDSGKCAIYIRV